MTKKLFEDIIIKFDEQKLKKALKDAGFCDCYEIMVGGIREECSLPLRPKSVKIHTKDCPQYKKDEV